MSLIMDELVQVVRTVSPCLCNASARQAKNVPLSYCCCHAVARATLCIFVLSGRSGQPAHLLRIVTARVQGGGGAFCEGWGLAEVAFCQLGFFGQFLDMCPCCLQKKHHPSAIRHRFSSLLRGFWVLMVSMSIAFGS
jgi:hypothetical protein